MNDDNKNAVIKDAKKIFFKKGTCSQAFFHILNREFGYLKDAEEIAADTLAGGILRQGHQCGMLWGSTLAAGAEAFRREKNQGQAINTAITAAQHIVQSFVKRTNTVDCADITETDWTSKLSMAKYTITGKFMTCFNLSENWAYEAIESAKKGLASKTTSTPEATSCASEVVKKMGATDEEAVIVAGLAGGIGLSGNGCGALAAAIWLKTLRIIQEQNKKPGMSNPDAEKILKKFQTETDYEMLCSKISGQTFKTVEDHSKFIKNGGCDKLIMAIANA